MTAQIEVLAHSKPADDVMLATIARATPISIFGHAVNVTLVLIAFQGNVDWTSLLLWSAASYGVGFWVLLRWLRRHKRSQRRTRRSSYGTKRAVISGIILAAPWGTLGFWLLGKLPPKPELILIALCVGMSASGSVLLSARYQSAIAYMACILVPVALKCFVVLGSAEYVLLGALTLSYSVFLLACIASCAKLFSDRDRALEELRQSLHETEMAKREIEQTNFRFGAALRNMPQGLSMFDGDDRLVAFNRQYLDIYGLSSERVAIGMRFEEVFADQTLVADLGQHSKNFKQQVARLGYAHSSIAFPDGRVIYISYAANAGGGWVATHEDITQRKAAERKIELLAHFDGLTGLANRNLFNERLDEALAKHHRRQSRFAVILLDLDRFKGVNDSLGHLAGDLLLREVANRIRTIVREADISARLGGDEFGLIVETGEYQPEAAAGVLADRLIQAISAPYKIESHSVTIGCSIGIATVPDHGERFDEILRNADLALYKSKQSGRNCCHFYSADLQMVADSRNALEIELRDAIWRDEIDVHYQPIFDLNSGEVALVEALARWNHNKLGLVSPSEFIPLAEESGLIVDLGRHILGRACRDATRMPNQVRLAVNLSPSGFTQNDPVRDVIDALAGTGLHESRLELEITESAFLEDNAENLETLERLRKIGVSVALDDFGAGFSSLSYLTAFTFNKVKIDKSFVQRLDRSETQTVLASIVQLAKSLNLSVVAEGIETEAQLEKVRSLGIDFGQGFLLGRPKPVGSLNFASLQASSRIEAA